MQSTLNNRSSRLLSIVFGMVIGVDLFGAATYNVTPLGNPTSEVTVITGINDSGQVSGYYEDFSPHVTFRGFILTSAGTTIIQPPAGWDWTFATGINNSGQVSGYAHNAFNNNTEAFVWTPTNGITLIRPPSGWQSSAATGINSLGQVCGYVTAFQAPGPGAVQPQVASQAFIGSVGGISLIPVPSIGLSFIQSSPTNIIEAFATGINDSGQVAGTLTMASISGNSVTVPLVGAAGGLTPIPPLAGLVPEGSVAGPNASGQAAGRADDLSNQVQAFIGTGRGIAPIPLTGGWYFSEATGINDSGQVVGFGFPYNFFVGSASGIAPLNDLLPDGWRIDPTSPSLVINNRGQIPALARGPNGFVGMVLLSPTATNTTVDQVTMFDDHTLRVDVSTQFSQNGVTQKTISITTTPIGADANSPNRIALDPSNCPDCSYTLPSGAVGQFMNSFRIDLTTISRVGLPRFTDNQVFDVTATVIEAGAISGTATKTGVEIPLPVVHVHGILTDCLGDRIPHALFQYLQTVHPGYTEDDGTSNLTAPYPTLVSFDYASMQQSVTSVAADLDSFIRRQVINKTYTAKVNIVAHSLGTIISRAAITFNGTGDLVNKLILVGAPTEGATLAPLALNFWATLNLIITSAAVIDPNFASAAFCIIRGTQDTARELQPIYPWWASTKDDVSNGPLGIPVNSVNPVLGFLNSLGLDVRVRYYDIVAGGKLTPTKLWGRNSLWPLELAAGKPPINDNTAYEPGDGIVPLRSAEAMETSWVRGTQPGQLNVFDNVGSVFHTAYFDNPRVIADVDFILWQ